MARAEELKNLYTPKDKPELRRTKSNVDEYEELGEFFLLQLYRFNGLFLTSKLIP
jgi:hypothetical protein